MKKAALGKLQVQSRSKEDLKTVALGTSKINYLDPRITIAWCKRQEVPMEKIFNKSLLSKFHWVSIARFLPFLSSSTSVHLLECMCASASMDIIASDQEEAYERNGYLLQEPTP